MLDRFLMVFHIHNLCWAFLIVVGGISPLWLVVGHEPYWLARYGHHLFLRLLCDLGLCVKQRHSFKNQPEHAKQAITNILASLEEEISRLGATFEWQLSNPAAKN